MAVAAAGAISALKIQDEFADDSNAFQYPTTCQGYTVWGNESSKTHLIRGTGAPSTDYNNAPNGSLYIDMTAFKIYIKTASSTWTVVGAQT